MHYGATLHMIVHLPRDLNQFLISLLVSPIHHNIRIDIMSVDLSTLAKNLKNGVYATKEEFYADTKLIFHNTLVFYTQISSPHQGKKSYILDL